MGTGIYQVGMTPPGLGNTTSSMNRIILGWMHMTSYQPTWVVRQAYAYMHEVSLSLSLSLSLYLFPHWILSCLLVQKFKAAFVWPSLTLTFSRTQHAYFVCMSRIHTYIHRERANEASKLVASYLPTYLRLGLHTTCHRNKSFFRIPSVSLYSFIHSLAIFRFARSVLLLST